MEIDQSKLKRQQEGVAKFLDNNCRGTFEFVTGAGKTYAAVLCKEAVNEVTPVTHIVVPTEYLQNQWLQELEHHQIKAEVWIINTYVKRLKDGSLKLPDFVILDEIHNYASETAIVHNQVFELTDCKMLGLSATLNNDQKKFLKEVNCPVIDTIGIGEATVSEFISDHIIYNIPVELTGAEQFSYNKADSEFKYFAPRFNYDISHIKKIIYDKKGSFTQRLAKDMGWEERFKDDHPYSPNNLMGAAVKTMHAIQKRKKVLHEAKNKIPLAKSIIDSFSGKSVTFSQTTATADELTKCIDNSIAYHSKIKPKQRALNLELFTNPESGVNTVNSATALDEGMDLPSLDAGVIVSYQSTPRQLVQRVGRLLRKFGNKQAKVAILYVANTQEEKWLKKAQKKMDQKRIRWVESIDEIN